MLTIILFGPHTKLILLPILYLEGDNNRYDKNLKRIKVGAWLRITNKILCKII